MAERANAAENLEKPGKAPSAEAQAALAKAEERARGPIAAYDDLISRARAVVGDAARTMPAADLGGVSYDVGPHAGKGVVLKSRSAVEFGGLPGKSASMVLVTSDEGLVEDGRVTVVGPNIQELKSDDAVPFVQIVVAAGQGLVGANSQAVEECVMVKDYIDGYFVRTAPGEITSRVGNALFDAGFDFDQLGAALIAQAKETSDAVSAVEVVFAAADVDVCSALAALVSEWKTVSHDLRHDAWLDEGVDLDCPSGGHCGNCSDKTVCAQVRQIQKLRKLEKEGK